MSENLTDKAWAEWSERSADMLNHWWPGCIQGPEDYYDERIRAAFDAGFSAGIQSEQEDVDAPGTRDGCGALFGVPGVMQAICGEGPARCPKCR